MSEPMSSVEIEDVLSSIRRLVSEDLRPAMRPVPTPLVEAPKTALILTPALRVVSAVDPADEPVVAPIAEASIEQVVAVVGAAVTARSDDWESETGDATPGQDGAWDPSVWDAVDDSAETSTVSGAAEEVEAFGGVAEVTDPEPTSAWAQGGPDENFVFHSHQAPDAPQSSQADPEWVDEAEAEVIAALEQSEPARARFSLLDDTPEMTFDEEVMRDLVRDLIREELQGQLGERITRNIRKLVRAEIARALAAAEFD